MIETRFKKTEIGEIPEEWDSKQLEQISILITDGAHNSPKESPIGFYMPSVKDMNANSFNFSSCKIIEEKDYLLLKRQGCQPLIGDVLIAKDGSMLKYCFAVTQYMPIVILSSIAIIRPVQDINSSYIAYYFKQNNIVDYTINNFKTGTGVPRIVLKNFAKIPVSIPPIPEQQRIATALSDIDALLSALNKKIEKKKLIKQGAMQLLFSGKKRLIGFTEPWVKKTLGDISSIYRGGSPRPISFFLTDNINGVNWIKIGDVIPKSKYINKTAERIKLSGVSYSRKVHKGAFILSNSMSFGRPYILNIDGCIHDGWLVIQDYQEYCNIDFLYYILSSEFVYNQYKSMAAGSSVQNLNKEKVAKVILCLPSSQSEQTAIATILSDMDKEIEALEAKLTKYERVKQGMMQQLLTGKIRLID